MKEEVKTVQHNSVNAASSKTPSSASLRPSDRNVNYPDQQTLGQSENESNNKNIGKANTGFDSEHGHSLLKIRPMTKHSGSSVVTFFNGLFQTIIAIGTLGTSVTFSYVVSNNTQLPNTNSIYDTNHVQLFLALSWLLFLLALAFACLGSTLLTFFKAHWVHDWDGEHGVRSQIEVQLYAVFASGLMAVLVVGAFILLCLVVVAYTPVVGWIALGFTCWFGLLMFVCVLYQLPWAFKKHAPVSRNLTP